VGLRLQRIRRKKTNGKEDTGDVLPEHQGFGSRFINLPDVWNARYRACIIGIFQFIQQIPDSLELNQVVSEYPGNVAPLQIAFHF